MDMLMIQIISQSVVILKRFQTPVNVFDVLMHLTSGQAIMKTLSFTMINTNESQFHQTINHQTITRMTS